MTKRFDNFCDALEELCIRFGVVLDGSRDEEVATILVLQAVGDAAPLQCQLSDFTVGTQQDPWSKSRGPCC